MPAAPRDFVTFASPEARSPANAGLYRDLRESSKNRAIYQLWPVWIEFHNGIRMRWAYPGRLYVDSAFI